MPETLSRRVTCSFAEPVPEKRRSFLGKPYKLPRAKSPALEGMVIPANKARTTSMFVHTDFFPRRAMALFKRANSAAVCTNSNTDSDIGEAQKWQRMMK
jgi:hypothetical protein